MTTWQFKIFAWLYTALDTGIAGGATAFLLAVNGSHSGQQPIDLKLALQNAAIAAVINLVMYLRQSPLPQLIQQKRDLNDEREKLQDEIVSLRAELALRDGELKGGKPSAIQFIDPKQN